MAVNTYLNHLFVTIGTIFIPQNFPLGVLVGQVGTGKSSLFNKITNKNLETSNQGSSTTRHAFSSPCGYGDYKFKIIDTPGTCAEEEKLSHALYLRSALMEGPINRIFLLIKWERVGAMRKNLGEQIFALQDWKHLITVVITHWDRQDTQENRTEFEKAKKYLLDSDPDLQNSFIFVGQFSNPLEVCNAFYKSMCMNNPTQLKIDDKDFKYKFDIFENMTKHILKYKQIFKEISEYFLEEMMRYNDNDKDEFLHACITNISEIAEDIIKDFELEYGQKMQQIQSYAHYLELKGHFLPLVEDIRKKASLAMSFSLLNHEDPRNKFRSCPNCNQIWIKVAGCDGITTCGNRVQKNDVIEGGMFKKFQFFWKDKSWKKQSTQGKQKNEQAYSLNGKGIGCGKQIDWLKAPLISLETLKQLQDIGISDFKVDYKEEENKDFNEIIKKESQGIKVQNI